MAELRQPGETALLSVHVEDEDTPGNNPVTGLTAVVTIRRTSDGFYWDFTNSEWDDLSGDFSNITADNLGALTDNTDGTYSRSWDQATADASAERTYEIRYAVTAGAGYVGRSAQQVFVFSSENASAAVAATIATDVAGLDGDAMRGTDGAAVAGDEMTLEDGAITDATLAADTDTYQAKVTLIDDNTGTADRYIVVFYKNSQPIVTGITTPTIQVVQLDDGEDLIEATALAQVDTTGMYQLTDGARTTAGASYMAIVKGTIAGSERSWYQPIGRDSV